MPHLFMAASEVAESSNLLAGGEHAVVPILLGLLGWFVKVWLGDMTKAINRYSRATEDSTKVMTIALLAIAALVPGSKPILEEMRKSAEARSAKTEGEP